jgi:LacI family transcriptional regulator
MTEKTNPTKRNSSPDIHRVALEAGVSIASVSRALHNPERINVKTRERVLQVANKLGYRPNRLGQRLRKGKAELVGVVLPTPHGQFGSPFFLELLAGLGEGLDHSGLELVVSACPPGPDELGMYRKLVEGRRVDALIVSRTRRVDERIQYLLEQHVPFVAHGRTAGEMPFAYLDMDAEHGFLEATRHLIALGHERIALVNAPLDLNLSHHRFAGYQRALLEANIALEPALIAQASLGEEAGHDATLKLLEMPNPPTAILCVNDQVAFGAMHALRERGLRAGREVSIIGYDDTTSARYSDPPLTTMQQPTRAAGRKLAEMLLALIAGTPPERLQTIWQPELIFRATHGPAPRSRR